MRERVVQGFLPSVTQPNLLVLRPYPSSIKAAQRTKLRSGVLDAPLAELKHSAPATFALVTARERSCHVAMFLFTAIASNRTPAVPVRGTCSPSSESIDGRRMARPGVCLILCEGLGDGAPVRSACQNWRRIGHGRRAVGLGLALIIRMALAWSQGEAEAMRTLVGISRVLVKGKRIQAPHLLILTPVQQVAALGALFPFGVAILCCTEYSFLAYDMGDLSIGPDSVELLRAIKGELCI